MKTKKKAPQTAQKKLEHYAQLSVYAQTIDQLDHALFSQQADHDIIFNKINQIVSDLQQAQTLFTTIRTLTIDSKIENNATAPLVPFLLGGIANIYRKFYQVHNDHAFLMRKDIAIEAINITQSSLFQEYLTIETYCDILSFASQFFKISCLWGKSQNDLPGTSPEALAMCALHIPNKAHFMQQLNTIFEEIIKQIALEERGVVSSERKIILHDIKLTAYSAALVNRIMMHLLDPKQRSSLIEFFQNTAHLLLDKEMYTSMLNVMSQTEKPNMNVIALCFKQLQKHQSSFDATSFELLWTALIKWGIHSVKKPSPTDQTQLPVIFDIVHESIRHNLLPQPEHWFTLLSIFYTYKKYLTENQYEKIYAYASILLKTEHIFNYKHMLHDKERYLFETLLLLLSSSPHMKLAQIKELYFNFKEQNSDLINQSLHELIITILLKSKNFQLNEFELLLLECTKESNDKIPRLLGHLFKENQDTSADFVRLCTTHLTTIITNKNIYALFLRRLDATLIAQFPDIEIQQEYSVALEVEQLTQQLHDKWSNTHATGQMLRIINKSLETMNALCARNFLPSEKKLQLAELEDELSTMFSLSTHAEQQDIKINCFKSRFLKDLSETPLSLAALRIHREQYEQAIQEQKERIKEAKKKTMSLQEAQRLLKQGELNDLEQINGHLLIPPKEIAAHLVKIKCLVKLGYYDEALVWLAKTKRAFPGKENQSLLQNWATCCKALGQYTVALEAYQQLLGIEKKYHHYQTQLNIAQCYQLIGKEADFDNALVIYEQLLQGELSEEQQKRVMHAHIECLMKQNRFSEAHNLINTHFIDENDVERHILSASLYYQKNDYTTAATYYERAFCIQGNIRWLNKLLDCYQNTKHETHTKKEMVLNTLTRNTTQTHETLGLKISMYMRLGDYKNARDTLKIMNEKWGKTYFTYIQDVLCLRAEHHFDEAINLLCNFPGYQQNKTILKHLATTYAMAGMQEKALQAYDDLLLEYPSYAQAYRKVIIYCLQINDIDRAHFYWQQCQDYCGEHHDLLSFLAQRLNSNQQYCFVNEQAMLDEEDHMIALINQHASWSIQQQQTSMHLSQFGFYGQSNTQEANMMLPFYPVFNG